MSILQQPLVALALLAVPALAGDIDLQVETYRLDNGVTVILHPDRRLPNVVIDTWFAVGSKDEAPGRTGFAHLFEHLMFMGTGRVPGAQFDVIMESGGGSNNATTSNDRTNYYSQGPSEILPTLLWLDADRMAALADHMTQEKLDRQREVVRNERRQRSENTPYGEAQLVISEELYPAGHPYHHPVIGSHEDLQAATVEDVVTFFRTYYVPSNATLAVVGDFDAEAVKPLIARTFGAIPAASPAPHKSAEPVTLPYEKRRNLEDDVQFPRLYLVWPSPAYYRPGDAEMDLVASILSEGPSSRLQQRLIYRSSLAQDVVAYQSSGELGSEFTLVATGAAPDTDLDELKAAILAEIEDLASNGPRADELERAKVRMEAAFRQRLEGLLSRADALLAYQHHFGEANSFQRDLDRWLSASVESVRDVAASALGAGRVDLRVHPARAAQVETITAEAVEQQRQAGAATLLDERPTNFAPAAFRPPTVHSFELANGLRVVALPRPGSGLFSGRAIFRGGEGHVPPSEAGTARLFARLLESGAGGLDAAEFASSVDALGASIDAGAATHHVTVGVDGLTSRLAPTLDRFADVILRPNLTAEDFARERDLQLAEVARRADEPNALAQELGASLTYGAEDFRGRPRSGTAASLAALDVEKLRAAQGLLLHPATATFVFAGDFSIDELRGALDSRFGSWKMDRRAVDVRKRDLGAVPQPGLALFDRPGAPQTVVWITRPLAPAADLAEEAARRIVDTVLGGSFTSRLNSNLREEKGYTYGAFSRLPNDDGQTSLISSSAVRTDVTGAALAEFRAEFARLATEGISAEELEKAKKTIASAEARRHETTASAAGALASRVRERRALDGAGAELEALRAVTPEQANAVAAAGPWSFDDLLVVLVGDAAAVLPQLAEHGFGSPRAVDADGRPLQ